MDARRSFRAIGTTSVLCLGTLLASCSTQPGTIYRTFNLDDGDSVSIGARQRVVTNTDIQPTSRPGLVNPRQIVCAEPSPDVAIAVANSFGAGISIFGQGSGAVSGSQAEGLAQLAERTVTVQLLRDQMYRACESYANGAISGTTYSLLMSKNNDAMITLMLAETAGGAFGRSLAAIGGAASSEAQAKLQGFGAVTGDFKQGVKDLTAADEKVAAAKEKLADKEKQQADQQAEATDAVKAKNQQEVDDAKKELAEAEAERNQIAESLQSKSEAAAESAAEISKLTAAGGIESKASPEIAKVLAGMQVDFLDEDFADEYVSACLVELGLVQVNTPFDELTLEDAVHAYQAAQLQERDEILGKSDVSRQRSPDLTRATEDRLSTVSSISARNRRSGLAKHCETNLNGLMTIAMDQKFKLDKRALRGQRTVNRKEFLEQYNIAAAGCAAITNTAQQVQCRNAVAKFIDPSAKPVAVPSTPVGAGGPVLPLAAYETAEQRKAALAAKEIELKATTVPAVIASDPLKDQKEALKKSETAFLAETSALVAKAGDLVSDTEKDNVQTLNDEWSTLEAQRQKALSDGDKLNAKKYTAEIIAQQVDAELSKQTYENLITEIETLLPKLTNHIAAVKALQALAGP